MLRRWDLPAGCLLCNSGLFSMFILCCFFFCSMHPAHLGGRVPVRRVHPIDLLTCGPSTLAPSHLTRTRPCCSPVILIIPPAANTPVTPSSTLGLGGQPSRTENSATMRDHLHLFQLSPPWTKGESKRSQRGRMVITLSVTHLQSCRRDSTALMVARARLHSAQRTKQQLLGLQLINPQGQHLHPNLIRAPSRGS